MFTGIIEATARLRNVEEDGSNRHFWIESSLTPELRIDQSVAHDGVCLTVVEILENTYRVTAVEETLRKTTLAGWLPDRTVNLERSLRVGDRLDGHFVQGHVDAIGYCTAIEEEGGSWRFSFSFPQSFAPLIVEKGSICINGVSLTAFDVKNDGFAVAIIPYTFTYTTFEKLRAGDAVNLEFDVLGKYLLRQQALNG